MNRRATGTVFCAVSAIIYAMNYLVAAIYMSGASEWSQNLFDMGRTYIGNGLTIISAVLFIIGIVYLIWGELADKNKAEN